jgi:hypothetical protein
VVSPATLAIGRHAEKKESHPADGSAARIIPYKHISFGKALQSRKWYKKIS